MRDTTIPPNLDSGWYDPPSGEEFDKARHGKPKGEPPLADASVTQRIPRSQAIAQAEEALNGRRLIFSEDVPEEVIQRLASILATPRWIMDERRKTVFMAFLVALDPGSYDKPEVRNAPDEIIDDLFLATLGEINPDLKDRFSEIRVILGKTLDPGGYETSVTKKLGDLMKRNAPPPLPKKA